MNKNLEQEIQNDSLTSFFRLSKAAQKYMWEHESEVEVWKYGRWKKVNIIKEYWETYPCRINFRNEVKSQTTSPELDEVLNEIRSGVEKKMSDVEKVVKGLKAIVEQMRK